MDIEFDYITQMVEDTFEGPSPEPEQDNVLPFLQPDSSGLRSEQLSFDFNTIRGIVDHIRGCMSLEIAGQHIEIPLNWGPFKLYNLKEDGLYIRMTKYDDLDLFIDVLESLLETSIDNLNFHIIGGEVFVKLNEASTQDIAA